MIYPPGMRIPDRASRNYLLQNPLGDTKTGKLNRDGDKLIMLMKLQNIVDILTQIAPPELAEDWDNVGLLAGDYTQPIHKAMLCVDMTTAVCNEANSKAANLIIAYHPPIWEPLKRIIKGQSPSPHIYDMVHNGIAIYALHTALDSARGGINDLLADVVGITNAAPLLPGKALLNQSPRMYKLVVFVPVDDLERLSQAVFAAGAGSISPDSKYSKCSFRVQGTGTFLCGPQSRPAIGKPGNFEQVQEYRLETIVPDNKLKAVIKAMLNAHSYEEVAYDIIPLYNVGANGSGSNGNCTMQTGLGRYGPLSQPIKVKTLVAKIQKHLKLKAVALIGPGRKRSSLVVKKAAVCAGSCGSILQQVIERGCDFYLTGELKHHDALKLQEAGVTTLCTGHSHSERIILHKLAKQLSAKCPGVRFFVSRKDIDPVEWRFTMDG